MRRNLAHLLRRVARMMIRWSNKLDPPVVQSPAQQGLDMLNASIRRMGRIHADNAERMRLDMEYHAQMAMLRQ